MGKPMSGTFPSLVRLLWGNGAGTLPSGVESVSNSLVRRAQEYSIFVADLSRDVTSQQLLVGTLVWMCVCACTSVWVFYMCVRVNVFH